MSHNGETIYIGNGFEIEVYGYKGVRDPVTVTIEGAVDFRFTMDEPEARALAAQLIAAADYAEGVS